MNLRFFGGANEVGASSTEIKIDGYRILVDAGIRMGPGQDSQLPDLPDFDKECMPDAVLVTHAHTDHTAALPVLRDLWLGGVKLYWTSSTKAISHVLLKDSVERMQREEEEERKPPLYTCEDLEVLLHCMEVEVPWLKPVEICPGVTATWIPAGHILGAAMIYIQGKHESILMTGDVSVTPQLTIPGLDMENLPYQPDVMVMESTYGNRQHGVTRKQEEKRLVEDVAKTIAAGGKVLIPAFAVGRSQEVILILKAAMERGEIPAFPVYVDGMVRKVNDVYSRFSDELSPSLRRKAERDEDLFYSDAIQRVSSKKESESLLEGTPCCIVASSGMLIGGKSSFYAKHLAKEPKNLIAITGYQAEGAPGRELWDWVEEAGRPSDWMWQLNDQESVDVKCQVEKYSLSAHADSTELIELVEKVQPRKLFLVHGAAGARDELFKSVRKRFPDIDVKLPENGKSYSVGKQDGLCKGRRLRCDRILSEVFDFVRKMERKGPFRVRELTEIWFGTESTTQIAVMFFQWCLSLDVRYFERRSDDLFYLRQPV